MSRSSWGNQDASPAFIVGWLAVFVVGALVLFLVAQPTNVKFRTENSVATQHNYNLGHLCRAAISMAMLRPVNIITVDSLTDTFATVSYTRPDDGTLWRQKCKLVGDHVVWGAIDGRWRDRYDLEERLILSVAKDGSQFSIQQIHPDGSGDTRSFNVSDF